MSADFRSRLRKREPLLGTMVTLSTPSVAEILSEIGFDWLFVDGEHGPLEIQELLGILQAVGHKVPCLVRVPSALEVPIKQVLDLGAHGIIVPQVNTVQQAEDVVRFSRYSPLGSRGVGLARAHGYGLRFQEYLSTANEEISVIVQAEHALAAENIEKIVQVPGIDGILLGPYDLSASFGKPGKLDDPAVMAAVNHITKTCLAAQMPLGVFGVSAAAVKPYIERGYNLIVAGVDALLLASAAKRLLADMQ